MTNTYVIWIKAMRYQPDLTTRNKTRSQARIALFLTCTSVSSQDHRPGAVYLVPEGDRNEIPNNYHGSFRKQLAFQ